MNKRKTCLVVHQRSPPFQICSVDIAQMFSQSQDVIDRRQADGHRHLFKNKNCLQLIQSTEVSNWTSILNVRNYIGDHCYVEKCLVYLFSFLISKSTGIISKTWIINELPILFRKPYASINIVVILNIIVIIILAYFSIIHIHINKPDLVNLI